MPQSRPWKGTLAAITQHRSCCSAYGYTATAKGLAQHAKLHVNVHLSLALLGFAGLFSGTDGISTNAIQALRELPLKSTLLRVQR